MQPVLFDTAIYISALRKQDGSTIRGHLTSDTQLWLSAVVLEELYAGAKDYDRRIVEVLERNFTDITRVLVPNRHDWTEAGRLLARVAAKHGYEEIGRGRLTNDALIALSAARLGIQVITTNQKDFAKLAEFRNFEWKVADS